MKVLKFGGTSVKDAAAMTRVAEIIGSDSGPLVVVLSATAQTTDALIEMLRLSVDGDSQAALELFEASRQRHLSILADLGVAQTAPAYAQIHDLYTRLRILLQGVYYLRESTPRVYDAVVSTGELVSTQIFAAFLQSRKKKAVWFDVREVMRTDRQFGSAKPDIETLHELCAKKLAPLVRKSDVVVTQGFIGATDRGTTTTLGRGGSDYSAALLGDALNAATIEIWTDVSGIMTADPRMVPAARSQRELSFKEAAELAYFGAKVLHPSTILPAMHRRIPVIVKNTMQPDDPGSTITHDCKHPGRPKAIAFRRNITTVTVESSRMLNAHGFLARIFDVFARHEISVDLISTSEISVSLTIDDPTHLEVIYPELEQIARVSHKTDQAIISIVGEAIKSSPHFLNKVFAALDEVPIDMISFGASDVNLSLVSAAGHLETAVKKLHQAFFE